AGLWLDRGPEPAPEGEGRGEDRDAGEEGGQAVGRSGGWAGNPRAAVPSCRRAVARQGRRELRRSGKPIRRQLLQRREYRPLDLRRDGLPLGGQGGGLRRHHLGNDRLRGGAVEWRLADQHLV